MKTIQEKITFVFAALLYFLFHLRGGADAGEMLIGTAAQLLTTLPYCIGFTFIAVRIVQYLHHGKKLRWDRIARIFFTIGILFGFFFALYEYAEQGQPQQVSSISSAAANAPAQFSK
jgi:formate hydrogenlyase subunit 3/multisubunit Na+/H+ antiporter MnhD subunit